MAAIDIGSGATNRAGTVSGGTYTDIDLNNPSNATGTLTSVEIWAATDLAGCVVGTFYESGGEWYCRDSAAIGAVTAGSKQTFDVSLTPITVQTGDYLGIYYTSGSLERDTSGYEGLMYYPGELADAGDHGVYTLLAGDSISIYATGTTTAWAQMAKVDGVTATDLAKVGGIAVASISKACGVEV